MRFGPSLLREVTTPGQLLALQRSPLYTGGAVVPGDGSAVVLVPGFLCGDRVLGLLHGWLRRSGYRTYGGGIGRNTGCAEHEVQRLEAHVEAVVARVGERVAVLGYSRGGSFARALATRRPDLVRGVVTLGTPSLDPLCVHAAVAAPALAITALGSAGVPGLLRLGCFKGRCCERFRDDLVAPLDPTVGYVAVRSRRDGVVDHRYTPDAGARHVELTCTHAGYIVDPQAYAAVARALRGFTTTNATGDA